MKSLRSFPLPILLGILMLLSAFLIRGADLKAGLTHDFENASLLAAMNNFDHLIYNRESITANTQTLSSTQLRALAMLALQDGDPQQVEQWLKTDNVNEQTSRLTYFGLCRHYWDVGDYEAAVAACRTGEVPASPWIRLGLLSLEQKDFDQSYRYFQMAVDINPDSAATWFRLGNIQFERKKYTAVIPALTKALELGYPPAYGIYSRLGQSYTQLARFEEAIQIIDRGLVLFPDARALYLDRIAVARAQSDYALVDDLYAQVVDKWPQDANSWARRGELALLLHDPTAALRYYQYATLYQSDYVAYWLGVASAAVQIGDEQTARVAYQKILSLEPDNAQAQAGLNTQ